MERMLDKLWPDAKPEVRDRLIEQAPALFKKYGLNSILRIAHFMAQISHESNGGTITIESLYYTHPERIAHVWPKRFTTVSAMPFVGKPQLLANTVYNGRMGNASASNDGWTYRGRGFLQITGRGSYETVGQAIGVDLLTHPDLAFGASALEVALYEFAEKLRCLPFCDANDVKTVTLHVNGGYTGLESRTVWLLRWKKALALSLDLGYTEPEPVAQPQGVFTMVDTATPAAPKGNAEVSWIVARMREPSTYAGLSILLGFVGPMIHVNGAALSPELQNLGMALGAIIAIVMGETA